jgi:hypothetical protein
VKRTVQERIVNKNEKSMLQNSSYKDGRIIFWDNKVCFSLLWGLSISYSFSFSSIQLLLCSLYQGKGMKEQKIKSRRIFSLVCDSKA